MEFIDNFNMIFKEVLGWVVRLFPFIFCFTLSLILFLNLISMFIRWIRSHCKEANEDDN